MNFGKEVEGRRRESNVSLQIDKIYLVQLAAFDIPTLGHHAEAAEIYANFNYGEKNSEYINGLKVGP